MKNFQFEFSKLKILEKPGIFGILELHSKEVEKYNFGNWKPCCFKFLRVELQKNQKFDMWSLETVQILRVLELKSKNSKKTKKNRLDLFQLP